MTQRSTDVEQAREKILSIGNFYEHGIKHGMLRVAIDDLIAAVRAEQGHPNQAQRLLDAVKAMASKGYRHLDADEESKAMKVLSALAGVPGCYPEIDALYMEIGRAAEQGQAGQEPTR